jgi:hypothetical protein
MPDPDKTEQKIDPVDPVKKMGSGTTNLSDLFDFLPAPAQEQ